MKTALDRFNEIFTGIPATVASAALLISSIIISQKGINCPVNPAWAAVIISGLPLYVNAVRKLICGSGLNRISPDLLISIAMTAAILIGDLFAAGEVAVIMAIGDILEKMTVDKAKKGVGRLLSLAPATGRLIRGGEEEIVPIEQVKKGDLLRVLPGETVPVDGVIVEGETSIDQSVLTGESLPVDRSCGDTVFCGTVNRFGAFDLSAVNVGEDSSLKKMARLVEEAQENKAPTARIVDRYAALMVPSSLLLALITFIVTKDITRSVTVLLVFCPCALALATPTAVMAAIGQATKQGVIIKSGEALEAMGKVNTVAFDKTGTLTYGRLNVSDIVSFDDRLSKDDILSVTASAEGRSEHPLGKAVVEYAKRKKLPLVSAEDFSMTAGRGISATIKGINVLCGSERCMLDENIVLSDPVRITLEKFRASGKASIITAADGHIIGLIGLSDVIRPSTKAMVSCLADLGVETVLLTGDNGNAASYFASQAGIKTVCSDLLPEEKAQKLMELRNEGHDVCMVGDGVNDAVALKTANVGVAMGGIGSDIAAEAADIVLMSDDISRLPYLKRLSVETVKTIKIGITASMTINTLALIFSMMGILGPTAGALVHNVGSVLVVMFAGMLYDRDLASEDAASSENMDEKVLPGTGDMCESCVNRNCAVCVKARS